MNNKFLHSISIASLALFVAVGPSVYADTNSDKASSAHPAHDEPMAHPTGVRKQIYYSYKDEGAYVMRASDFIGKKVENNKGKSIGKIKDFVVEIFSPFFGKGEASQKAPLFTALISVGGAMGVGGKLVGVPFEDLEMKQELGKEGLVYAGGLEALKGLPEYHYPHLR
jgi:hypothetical protein